MIKVIEKINKEVSKYGPVVTSRNFLKKCNTDLVVSSNKKIDEILKKSSGIIVANHPAEADVLAMLAAVKKRKDIFLIINSSLTKIIPNLDKHLIPVYVNSKTATTFDGRLKMKILSIFHEFNIYSRDEEKLKNIESINLAIEKINQGGLVIIFPDGGNGKMDWFNGIGYLIHGVKDKKNKFVIRARIEGTSNWDYLRLLPFVNKFLPKIKVSFSNPIEMSSVKMDHPKIITQKMERKYWKWLGSIHLWNRLSRNYSWLKMLFLFWITKPY